METNRIASAERWLIRHARRGDISVPPARQVAEQIVLHKARTGHAWIASTERTRGGEPIGLWLAVIRDALHRNRLDSEDRRALVRAGLVVGTATQSFIDTIDHLASYRDRHGRTVPQSGPAEPGGDGFPLAEALRELQRKTHVTGAPMAYAVRRLGHLHLNTHRIIRSHPTGLSTPNLYRMMLATYGPEDLFRSAYRRYLHIHQTPDVPYDYMTAEGVPLGSWFEVLAATPQRATLPGKDRNFVEALAPHVAWAVRSTAQAHETRGMLVSLELQAGMGSDLRLIQERHSSEEARWLRDVFPTARVTRDEARRFTSLGLRNTHIRHLNRTDPDRTLEIAA